MSDAKKKYVVVFDVMHVPTGELTPGSPGSPPLMVVESKVRGDEVELTDAEAERHLEVGAILLASDKRAKQVKRNDPLGGGIKRDASLGYVALEQTAPAAPGDGGATRTEGVDYANMKVADLKKAAKTQGIEVGPRDNKQTLVKKLQAHAATGTTDELRPGQGPDQSPPPVDQPDEPPAK